MSRKVPSFDQLIGYMDLGASGRENNIYHNLYSRKAEDIENEFIQNSRFLHKRKNGVFMYHEVISITRSQQIEESEQIEILRHLVYRYIQDRANENLVYAVLHDDKSDNLHYHLLISSNHLESSKRHRLSKAQFSKVKKNLEIYTLEQHPELEQKKLISKEISEDSINQAKKKDSISNKGAELKRRTGRTPDRDRVRENLRKIFSSATTHEEFLELLESENLKIYKRGKNWGVLDEKTNRKHRFKTLGVADEFEVLDKKLSNTDDQVKQENKDKNPTKNQKTSKQQAFDEEVEKRKSEMKEARSKQAEQKQNLKKKQ